MPEITPEFGFLEAHPSFKKQTPVQAGSGAFSFHVQALHPLCCLHNEQQSAADFALGHSNPLHKAFACWQSIPGNVPHPAGGGGVGAP